MDDVIHDLGMRRCDIAYQQNVFGVERVEDILEAHAKGRIGRILGIESATPIEGEMDRIEVLYGLGCRQIGVTYSQGNLLGSGVGERSDGGLTSFGQRCVRRMNQVGIAIDLSHSGDLTTST